MEPKISGNSKGLRFPYEPKVFSQPLKRKEDLIPRIVPAELNSPVPTSAKTETPKFLPLLQNPLLQALPPAVPLDKLLRLPFLSAAEPSSVKRKDPREMMAALSRDLEELSAPLSQKPKSRHGTSR